MQYTRLGQTGLIVSRLAFGAMTFSAGKSDVPSLYKVGAEVADELVGAALDAGVNFFDTADAYAGGDSESLLGAALKSRRSEVVIATKVGFRSGASLTQTGLSRRHIRWSVEQSLRRLGTDWIDTYIVHCEDPFTPLEETLQALDDVVRSGKVRYLGFSNWSAWKAASALDLQKANGWAPFTHCQMNYSLLGRDVERDVILMMKHFGLGLTVWSPLAAGFLSGKYTRENLKDDPANRLASLVEDVRCAVDYLTTLPLVDAARIGSLGICAGRCQRQRPWRGDPLWLGRQAAAQCHARDARHGRRSAYGARQGRRAAVYALRA